MENDEELLKKMKDLVGNKDYEGMKKIIIDIAKDFNFQKFDWLEDFFLNPNLDVKTKIAFCLTSFDISNEGLFYRQVIPHLLTQCASENITDLVDLVTEDVYLQELLTRFIRECPDDSMKIWHGISNLPLVKEKILNDEDFVAIQMRDYGDFFENLPNEYAHLICYYNAGTSELDYEFIKFLYEKYLGNSVDTDGQNLMIALHYILEKKNNMGINPRIAMQPSRFLLSRVLESEEFFYEIDEFEKKYETSFISSVGFISNYYYCGLYKELMNLDTIDEHLREKIKYLSKVEKVVDINSLNDLNSVSIEELKQMEKDPIYVDELLTSGGPTSLTSRPIFSESASREIRSIKKDGTITRLEVGNQESHESKVKEIYEEEIEFPSSCVTVWQRSIESAKQLSAITLAIESEQCHIYMPSNISKEQLKALTELIETTSEKGRFGIAVYDHGKDRIYISGIELLDKNEAKDFVLRLNERTLQEATRNGGVIEMETERDI